MIVRHSSFFRFTCHLLKYFGYTLLGVAIAFILLWHLWHWSYWSANLIAGGFLADPISDRPSLSVGRGNID